MRAREFYLNKASTQKSEPGGRQHSRAVLRGALGAVAVVVAGAVQECTHSAPPTRETRQPEP